MTILEQARRDLALLSRHDVVLHGSAVTGRMTPRSDVDVAVVTHDADPERNRRLWLRLMGRVPDRYDVRVYELLPLVIQVRIADHHKVVFGDPVELSWDFYQARRRWKDQRHRYEANRFQNVAEKRKALQRAKAGGLDARGAT